MSTLNTFLKIIRLAKKGKTFRDKRCAFLLAGYPMIGLHRVKLKKYWFSSINSFCKNGQLKIVVVLACKEVVFSMRQGNEGDYTVGGELISEIYPRPDFIPEIIIDGGANIGMFSVLANAYFPNSTIYSYEPDEGNFSQLLLNIANNNINSKPHKMGLWSKKTTLYFHKSTSQIGYIDEVPPGEPIICDLPEIKNLCWIKLDIEGAEYEVLPAILDQPIRPRTISLELHHMHKNGKMLIDLLHEKKYILTGDVDSTEDFFVIQANHQSS